MTRSYRVIFALALVGVLVTPAAAFGYGGPGSIVSGIGALLAIVIAIAASIFGFVWFPLKRLIKILRRSVGGEGEARPGTLTEETGSK